MKKIIIPIIIAAVLGVGGGVATVMLNRPAAADKETAAPEVRTGNYYLNGDKDSGMYFELTEDYLALRIEEDAVEKFKKALESDMVGSSDEEITSVAINYRDDYCAENPYVVSVFGTEKTPYQLMIHWHEKDTGPRYSGIGFRYNGANKITVPMFGEFILVEEP